MSENPSQPIETNLPGSQGSWWRSPSRGGILLILTVFAFAPLVYMTWSLSPTRRVDRLWSAARLAAEPTTPSEMQRLYRIPPGDVDTTQLWLDALSILENRGYQKAATDLPVVGDREKEIPPAGHPYADQAAVEALLDNFSDALAKMHAAGRVNGSARFNVRFEAGYDSSDPHVEQLRDAAQLLQLEAHVRAHQRDVAGVWQSLNAMLAAADAISNEPTAKALFLNHTLCSRAARTFVALQANVEMTDEQIEGVALWFAEQEKSGSLIPALYCERLYSVHFIHEYHRSSGLPFEDDNIAECLAYMREAIEVCRHTYPAMLDAAEAMHSAERIRSMLEGSRREKCRTFAMFAFRIGAAAESGAANVCRARMVPALVAAEKFRRAKGRFPDTLEELVPDYLPTVPKDPFDGRPLRYITLDDACRLYSVYRNRLDDGGQDEDSDYAMTWHLYGD